MSPFNNAADDAAKKFILFLIFSMVIHVAAALSFLALSPVYSGVVKRIFPEKPDTLAVDVVELPPEAEAPRKAQKPAKEAAHYAQRTNIVEKETFPEAKKTGKYRPGIIIPPMQKAGKTAVHEGAKEGGPRKSSAAGNEAANTKVAGISKKAGQTDGETVKTGKEAAIKGTPAKADETAARPNLFLPEETISALEKKYEAESPKGEQGKTLNLNTSELRYANYLVNMKRRIELYWEYPEVASRSGWHGRLFINFTIKKDGTLGEITLAKSSGYPVLDDAAITALKLAAPFSAFPENFGIEQINIKGQFEYDITYTPPR